MKYTHEADEVVQLVLKSELALLKASQVVPEEFILIYMRNLEILQEILKKTLDMGVDLS